MMAVSPDRVAFPPQINDYQCECGARYLTEAGYDHHRTAAHGDDVDARYRVQGGEE